MSTWTARRLAWSVGIVSIVLLVAALVLMFVDRESDLPNDVATWSASDVLDVFVSLGVPVLGIVIVNKRPRNAIGWIFIVAGAALALATFGQAYALHALRADPGIPAGGTGPGVGEQRPVADPDRRPHPAVPPVPDRTPPISSLASRRSGS